MATNLYNLFKTLPFPVSHAHFWLRHRCFLRVSPKPSSLVASSHSGIGAFLWISPEPSSRALLRLCILCPVFGLCWYLWPFACFCTHLMFNISFGCCRHNVSNTFVQLTEGRSARDQPKQPPAKKTLFLCLSLCLFLCSWVGHLWDVESRCHNQRAGAQKGLEGCGFMRHQPEGEVGH